MIKEFSVKTSKRQEIVDITDKVNEIIKNSKVKQGLAVVYTPHATAAITINENYDPNVCVDILDALRKLVPAGVWKHDRVDSNADAHIKSAMIGPSEAIPIKDGKLTLGTWQALMLADFDGPRNRKVIVSIK